LKRSRNSRRNQVFLAASQGFETCKLRTELIFSLNLKQEQSEKHGLLMLTRKPTICSFVPPREDGKHGSCPGQTCHSVKYLPRPLLLTCSSLSHCSLNSRLLGVFWDSLPSTSVLCFTTWFRFRFRFSSARNFSFSIMCAFGCRQALQQPSCKPRTSGPLTRVDNGRAPRANSLPAPLHGNPSLYIGR